jgi:ABC-type glutathione transport system ATPase component
MLLEVKNLSVKLKQAEESHYILQDVNFTIDKGQTVAIIGQSGCGKTITARAILGLLPETMEKVAGEIYFEGNEVKETGRYSFENLRGKQISMVFQESVAALNPVFRIGTQLRDIIQTNMGLSKKVAEDKSFHILAEVGFENPKDIYKMYPNQLSGGMAQRAIIAMALSCEPSLIIADEPTSALDVSTQAKILNLICDLQNQHGFAILIISHDLHLVSSFAKDVYVFNHGKIVSKGDLNSLTFSHSDSYIQSLLDTLPDSLPIE